MFRVIFTPECRKELKGLHRYIAAQSSGRVAAKYMARLKDFCLGLSIAPHRGERRDGIRFDQRTIGFERRISVIFEVAEQQRIVNIVGIRYAGQNLHQDQ